MTCQQCPHRQNGKCEKYNQTLKLIGVEETEINFEKVEECDE